MITTHTPEQDYRADATADASPIADRFPGTTQIQAAQEIEEEFTRQDFEKVLKKVSRRVKP